MQWHGEADGVELSPWLCGPSLAQPLMLMKLLSTLSSLCLTSKCCTFFVSPHRDLGGNKLPLLWEEAVLLSVFPWECWQGKRKDRAEGKSTRAGTGCSARLCHPATNVPLGLRGMAARE